MRRVAYDLERTSGSMRTKSPDVKSSVISRAVVVVGVATRGAFV
jgi:hypothetical protein